MGNLCPVYSCDGPVEVVGDETCQSDLPSDTEQQVSATVGKNGVDAEADVITELFDKLPEDMTESQHTLVKNLLKNYDDVFSRYSTWEGRH